MLQFFVQCVARQCTTSRCTAAGLAELKPMETRQTALSIRWAMVPKAAGVEGEPHQGKYRKQ